MSRKKSVTDAREDAQPRAYASRYQFTMDNGGTVVPRNANADVPEVFRGVRFNRTAENELEAYVPALASGTIGLYPGWYNSDMPWQADTFGNWDIHYSPIDGKQDIRSAIRWWRRDPIVFKCVKVLTQLANAPLTIECENDEFRAIVQNWFAKAMPHSFRKAWFLEYFRSSMVPTIKTLIPYVPRDYKPNKAPSTTEGNVEVPMERATAEQQKTQEVLDRNAKAFAEFSEAFGRYQKAVELHKQGLCSDARLEKLLKAAASVQYTWLEGHIAGSYSVLDPLYVDIIGPDEMPWMRQPYLQVSGLLRTAVDTPSEPQAEIIAKLPLDIIRQIKEGKPRIWLSPNICSVVFGEKQPYERYPIPIACHCEEALEMKYMLMQMDRATAKSVRDKILKVTIGTDQYPEFDPAKIQALAQIFNNPSRNMTIFWNHTLKIEWVEPQNTLLADEKKFAHVNNEIRTAYGISSVITGTSDKGGSVGDGILNLKGLEEEIGEAQEAFLEWFNREVEMLRQALGVKFNVTAYFDRMNLKDEEKFMALLLQLYQNGLVDPQTALETMRFNYPTVVRRLETAMKQRKKGIFVPLPSSNNMGPDGGILGPQGGKPVGQPKKANQQKRGTSQPKKAVAKLLAGEDGISAYLVVGTDLDGDEREMIAEKFGLPAQWVLTEAEYTQATGKEVNWLPPLPDLSTAAAWAAMRHAQRIDVDIKAEVEKEIAAIRATGTGKRGKYVTDKLAGETMERVRASSIQKLRPEGVSAEEWAERKRILTDALQAEAGDKTEGDLRVMAACTLQAQYLMRANAGK